MEDKVLKLLADLNLLNEDILQIGKGMIDDQPIFPLDLLATAALNRSSYLIHGFTTLINNENFFTALHLVRLHLDTLIRFSAASIVKNPHEFAIEIMKGTQINHLKDKNGQKLSDKHLYTLLLKDYPWIERVYKQTSGFIHLSENHIWGTMNIHDKEALNKEALTVSLSIGSTDRKLEPEEKFEAIVGMTLITKAICNCVYSWVWTKRNPEKAAEIRKKAGL
jgi:hypothetical protein